MLASSATWFGKNARPPVSCANWRRTNSASLKPLRARRRRRPRGRWRRSRSPTAWPGRAPPRTAAGSTCPRRPTARRSPGAGSRRRSSRRSSSDPSARCRSRCTATSSRRPTSCGSPARARPALLVKVCRMMTRLSKLTISARSCGRRRLAKPIAASCAIGSRVSMLALVSSSSASAIGRLVRLKKVTSCLTPSSKTLKSSACRSVT